VVTTPSPPVRTSSGRRAGSRLGSVEIRQGGGRRERASSGSGGSAGPALRRAGRQKLKR
jgi:hypothetical protein